MIFIKPELSILVVFVVNYVQLLNPGDDNVCLKSEKYYQTVYEKKSEREEKTIVEWCWDVKKSFRCPRKTTVWKTVEVPREISRTRVVPVCCEGYREKSTRCLPICRHVCVNGNCVAPNTCLCNPGFEGDSCEEPCQPGYWGENCLRKCKCPKEVGCDLVTGVCFTTVTSSTSENPNTILSANEVLSTKKQDNFTELTMEPLTVTTSPNLMTNVPDFENPTNKPFEGRLLTEVTIAPETTQTTKTYFYSSTQKSEEKETFVPTSTQKQEETETYFTPSTQKQEERHTLVPTSTKKQETDTYFTTSTQKQEETESYSTTTTQKQEETESYSTTPTQTYFTITTPKEETEIYSVTSTQKQQETETYFTTSTQKSEETETYFQATTQKINESKTYFHISTQKTESTTLSYTTELSTITADVDTKSTFVEFTKNNEKDTTINEAIFTTEISNVIETHPRSKNNDVEGLTIDDSQSILNRQTHFKIIHFVPSLTVLTGVTILVFVIAGRYIIVRNRRRAQKAALGNEMFPLERRPNVDSVFSVSNFAENPVYLSEEDLNYKIPVLQTFKPLNAEIKEKN